MVALPLRKTSHAVGLLLLLVCIALVAGCGEGSSPQFETVTIKDHEFHLEVAADEQSITRGLGGRAEIAENGGMLFVFPVSSLRSFWMYDCLVDIDIIFLDATGHVIAIHRMKAEPLKREDETELEYQNRLQGYSSNSRARFAIELKAGWLDRLNLEVYEKLDLNLPRLKAYAD